MYLIMTIQNDIYCHNKQLWFSYNIYLFIYIYDIKSLTTISEICNFKYFKFLFKQYYHIKLKN